MKKKLTKAPAKYTAYESSVAIGYLRKIRGIFTKGPKDPITWQRAVRQDRAAK